MRDTERKAETQAEETQAPCREPDAGLDPGTLGSLPGPKADAQLLSHPDAPHTQVLKLNLSEPQLTHKGMHPAAHCSLASSLLQASYIDSGPTPSRCANPCPVGWGKQRPRGHQAPTLRSLTPPRQTHASAHEERETKLLGPGQQGQRSLKERGFTPADEGEQRERGQHDKDPGPGSRNPLGGTAWQVNRPVLLAARDTTLSAGSRPTGAGAQALEPHQTQLWFRLIWPAVCDHRPVSFLNPVSHEVRFRILP